MKRQRIDDREKRSDDAIGVDVSRYQGGKIDWSKVASVKAKFHDKPIGEEPVSFAIVRIADGVRTTPQSKADPYAIRNLRGAYEHVGLVAGYHYVRGYHPDDEQADLILATARIAGAPLGFIALDHEGHPFKAATTDKPARLGDGFWWHPDGDIKGRVKVETGPALLVLAGVARRLMAAGYRVIVYTGVAGHYYVCQKGVPWPDPLNDSELWTPYYTRASTPRMPCGPAGEPAPWPEWKIWQFAGSESQPGTIEGIPGRVDLNRFRGTVEDLRVWWSLGVITEGSPPETKAFERQDILDLADRAKGSGDTAAAIELIGAHERLAKGD